MCCTSRPFRSCTYKVKTRCRGFALLQVFILRGEGGGMGHTCIYIQFIKQLGLIKFNWVEFFTLYLLMDKHASLAAQSFNKTGKTKSNLVYTSFSCSSRSSSLRHEHLRKKFFKSTVVVQFTYLYTTVCRHSEHKCKAVPAQRRSSESMP